MIFQPPRLQPQQLDRLRGAGQASRGLVVIDVGREKRLTPLERAPDDLGREQRALREPVLTVSRVGALVETVLAASGLDRFRGRFFLVRRPWLAHAGQHAAAAAEEQP